MFGTQYFDASSNIIRLAGKEGFHKIDICCLGHLGVYRYFLADAVDGAATGKIVSIQFTLGESRFGYLFNRRLVGS
jgi:hypothetical protein